MSNVNILTPKFSKDDTARQAQIRAQAPSHTLKGLAAIERMGGPVQPSEEERADRRVVQRVERQARLNDEKQAARTERSAKRRQTMRGFGKTAIATGMAVAAAPALAAGGEHLIEAGDNMLEHIMQEDTAKKMTEGNGGVKIPSELPPNPEDLRIEIPDNPAE